MPANPPRKGLVNQGYVLELVSDPTQSEYLHAERSPREFGESLNEPALQLSTKFRTVVLVEADVTW